MLSGIKKGKRKRQSSADEPSQSSQSSSSYISSPSQLRATTGGSRTVTTSFSGINTSNPNVASSCNNLNNQNAADELRRMLAGVKETKTNHANAITTTNSNNNSRKSAIERFEQRSNNGIHNITIDKFSDNDRNEETIILMNTSTSTSTTAPIKSKEDFRHGSRKGKIKPTESYMKSNIHQSISSMIQEEKHQKNMDEIFARNIARIGSKYKATDFKTNNPGSKAGADEDDGTSIDMKMFTSVSDRLTDVERYNRELSRQVAITKKSNLIGSKCWWWMDSESFQKHRLIALGDYVSFGTCCR